MEAVKIKNIKKIYGSKDKKVTALNNITKEFEYGKFYLVTGHSGSGKTTLLRILGLIDNPTEGEITIDNKKISSLNAKEKSLFRNNELGFIFQEFYLDKYLTAMENVTIPMLINKKYKNYSEIKDRSIKLLKNVGLENRIKHFPKELSGGEQQRVAIARALAKDPKIIIADEPTGNLDIANEEYVFSILKEMSKHGKCIIMVSHSKDALKYADEVLELKEGNLL